MPNPYPANFTNLLDALPPGAVCLDLGSGGRHHPGVLGVEREWHPDNSLLGDCLRLPFRDGCADLILSQAVIEHVTDPQRAFDEMRRVLKPGGALYVEIAFMQPVHQAPHHYFNVTPHGLAWLLRDWDVEWQGTVGTFWETIDWLYRAVGALPAPDTLRKRARLYRVDDYPLVASGVCALARRRA